MYIPHLPVHLVLTSNTCVHRGLFSNYMAFLDPVYISDYRDKWHRNLYCLLNVLFYLVGLPGKFYYYNCISYLIFKTT